MKKVSILAILLPAVALANGYDVPNVNPRDLAMAGSLVAAQGDAAATYQNPAALSKVNGISLSVAGSFLDLQTEWSAPAGSALDGAPDAKTKFRPAPPVALFAAWGTQLFGRGAGVGFGMNVPGGGNVFYEDDWAGRGRIITVDRKLYGLYLTAGYELFPNVRIGGGPVYVYTTEYLKQGIQPFSDAYGELSTQGGGWGYDLSAEVTPLASIPLTLALDYKHKVRMELSGDGNFVVPDALLQPSPTDPSAQPAVDQDVKHVLTFPNVLTVGAAYRVAKPLLVTAAWTFNRYRVYRDDVFVGSAGTSIVVPRFYRNGYTFRLGAEYDATARLKVRAGVLRDISGLRTEYYSPTLPDGNAWAGSLGLGWKLSPNLDLNAAGFYALLDQVKQTGTEELPGVYDTRAYIISAGATWRTDLGLGK
jgi:long-chain fatty acid transport protein